MAPPLPSSRVSRSLVRQRGRPGTGIRLPIKACHQPAHPGLLIGYIGSGLPAYTRTTQGRLLEKNRGTEPSKDAPDTSRARPLAAGYLLLVGSLKCGPSKHQTPPRRARRHWVTPSGAHRVSQPKAASTACAPSSLPRWLASSQGSDMSMNSQWTLSPPARVRLSDQ